MLLETGGGIAKALPQLGTDPFYAANADIIWSDGAAPALLNLADHWDDDTMDALLLVHPTERAVGYDGAGDFARDDGGRLSRRGKAASAPYVFTGVQLLHPRLFDGAPEGAFSMNVLYDKALAAGRLHGVVHDGEWYHVGTPEALAEADTLLASREKRPAPAERPR